MKRTYSKDWCQGFCKLCGTSCSDHCEDALELRKENARLREALKVFLDDPNFKVAIGGNPSAVKKILEQAYAALEGK